MSSPEDALALTRELEQRQATTHFPTLATRSSARKERPSISSTLSHQTQGSHTGVSPASASTLPEGNQLDAEPKIDAELRAFLDSQNVEPEGGAAVEDPGQLPQDQEQTLAPPELGDDDAAAAGELEMDYGPGSAAEKAETQAEAEGSEAGGNEARTEADAPTYAAVSEPASQRPRGPKQRSSAASSASKRDALPQLSASPSKRRSLHRAGSSFVSTSKKRMTVLMDGEMPEGGEASESEYDQDMDETEGEDEEDALEGSDDLDLEEGSDTGDATLQAIHGAQRSISDQVGNGQSQPEAVEENGYVSPRVKDVDAEDQLEGSPLSEASKRREPKDGVAIAEGKEELEDEEEQEDSSEQDEEPSDEDSDEEVEPSLKYSRLKNSASDILAKDSASAFAVSPRFMALGTHGGMIYILDVEGNLIKGFRSHTASILDIDIDSTCEFVASASMDGLVSVSALSTSEQYVFDFKRPMRCIALEPNFGRRSTRALVCGGMAGALVQREKSWFGHKEVVLHAGEGPIWTTKWRSNLIAWANDRGVRIYDTNTHQRISFIAAPPGNVRADLHRCSLYWQDDRTLLISWADHIKIAKVKERKPAQASSGPSLGNLGSQHPQLFVEITAIFQLDCMISGIAPYGLDYLVLAYITEEAYDDDVDHASVIDGTRDAHRRREALRPELRIISRAGEELSSDVLSLNSFSRFQCNDYLLVPSEEARAYSAAIMTNKRVKSDPEASTYYVVSPKDVVVSRPRDDRDHVEWLLERKKYEAALVKVEAMGTRAAKENGFDAEEIGQKYLDWLVDQDWFEQAAKVASKILGRNVQAWEDWIFLFVEKGKLGTAIPFIPTSDPTLSGLVYDMILAHFLQHDPQMLLKTIREWPAEIYSTQAVVIAIEDRLSREKSSTILMECLAELFIQNRQPSKALPYFLRLRRPNVFDLIRDNNLFTAVQDQALLLIEFEEDLRGRNKEAKQTESVAPKAKHGAAIELLVDHTHSIPIHRVIKQLEGHSRYLYMYLDALFDRDPQQVSSLSDLQVKLYAEYEYPRLMAYLRAMSSFYSFEKAFNVCQEHDYVPEMVFLLGRVGDNKRALSLIIERMGDVERAIDFAKEQNDDDLWEDLLRYSETKPAFIRGLLENVGAEIDPIRLIRRIKDGLEIPGLKPALVKILHDFSLQVSLLEGCEAILGHDNRLLSNELQRGQDYAHYCDQETPCVTCLRPLLDGKTDAALQVASSQAPSPSKTVIFLCGHAHHLSCLVPPANIPTTNKERSIPLSIRTTSTQAFSATPSVRKRWSGYSARAEATAGTDGATAFDPVGYGPMRRAEEAARLFDEKLRYESRLRVLLRKGCPTCRREQVLASGLMM